VCSDPESFFKDQNKPPKRPLSVLSAFAVQYFLCSSIFNSQSTTKKTLASLAPLRFNIFFVLRSSIVINNQKNLRALAVQYFLCFSIFNPNASPRPQKKYQTGLTGLSRSSPFAKRIWYFQFHPEIKNANKKIFTPLNSCQ